MPNEPLQEVADVEAAPPLKRLQTGREDYRRLLMEKMRAPDGGYEEVFTVSSSGASPPRTEGLSGHLGKSNPLSLHDEVRRSHPTCRHTHPSLDIRDQRRLPDRP